MIAGINNNCIFELFKDQEQQKEKCIKGIFYAQKSDSDLNTGYQIPTYYLNANFCSCSWSNREAIAFLISMIINFIRTMTKNNEITPKLNNSKLKSTSVARHATPTLTLTGVKNPYLFCLRKIFRDFLEEEKRGHCFAEKRLLKKIESAMLLFPESRRELFNHLKH